VLVIRGSTGRIVAVLVVVASGCGGGSARGSDSAAALADALADAPGELAARRAALLAVECPPGTHLSERRRSLSDGVELRRACKTQGGAYEGPIVDYRREGREIFFHRRSLRSGRRDGLYVRIANGFATEMSFSRGVPVRAYRRWNTYGGRLLVEGAFDDSGRLDGRWRFWSVDGRLLSETTMRHGSGTIEIWRTPAGVTSTPRRLARLSCRDGLLDGESSYHRELRGATLWGSNEYDVTASFSQGVADGPWERTAAGQVERGRYARGQPIGDWQMVATNLCYRREVQGDMEVCVAPITASYVCSNVTSSECVHPVVDGRDVSRDPPPVSGWPGPPTRLDVERCELPEGFWD
jgi:hypothetical protein